MKSEGEPCQPGECFPLACNRKTKTCGGKQRPTKKQPPLSQLVQQNMELQFELKKMSHKFDVVLKELRDCCSKQPPMQIQPMKVSDLPKDLPKGLPKGLPMGMPTAIKLADWPKEEKESMDMGVGKVVETDDASAQTSVETKDANLGTSAIETKDMGVGKVVETDNASVQTSVETKDANLGTSAIETKDMGVGIQRDDAAAQTSSIDVQDVSIGTSTDPIIPERSVIETQTDPITPEQMAAESQTDPIEDRKPKSKDQANDPILPESQDAASQTEEEEEEKKEEEKKEEEEEEKKEEEKKTDDECSDEAIQTAQVIRWLQEMDDMVFYVSSYAIDNRIVITFDNHGKDVFLTMNITAALQRHMFQI